MDDGSVLEACSETDDDTLRSIRAALGLLLHLFVTTHAPFQASSYGKSFNLKTIFKAILATLETKLNSFHIKFMGRHERLSAPERVLY